MTWRRVFRTRLYVRDSLWVLPLAAAVLGAVLGSVDIWIEKRVHVSPGLHYSSSTATAVLAAIVGATAALTGFVVTVTTLVVQMATGTFSARYMRLWYRDRMLKILLGVLVGTLAFSFSLMRPVSNNFVPDIGVSVAGFLLIASLLAFLVFLDRYLHRLRPLAVAALVYDYFVRNFEYEVNRARHPEVFVGVLGDGGEQESLVVRSPRAGAILRLVGTTDLAVELGRRSSATGVVIPARSWEDYLTLTTHEIQEYGTGGIQIMRRLRAMLEELHDEVRPEYRAAVRRELGRLDATVEQAFRDSVDLDRARVADRQGIGGPRTRPADPITTR